MENIARPLWKPNEAEHAYLVWELRSMGNTVISMPDAFICGQLFTAFRNRFGVSLDPGIPSYDSLVRITQEYRHSLTASTSATNFDLTPASFVSQDLSDPGLAINLFGGYIDPSPHNLIQSGTLNNTPIQLNNSTLDFNQGAANSYPDYFLPDMPPNTRNQMRRHENPIIDDPIVDGPLDDKDPDDVELAIMDRTQPIVSQYLAKSGGRHAEKNMYYPNKTTAATLYGKSIVEATAKVDKKIRLKPSLQAHRVKLINEERAARWNSLTEEEQKVWTKKAQELNESIPDLGTVQQRYKLLKAKIQQVHHHTNEALGFPVVSMAFLPADGYEKPRAMIFDCHSDGHKSFTEWLEATHGRKVLANFLSYTDEFAKTVGGSVEQLGGDDDGSDAAKVVSKVAGPLRTAYRTGVFERWVARGWTDKKMPWTRVEEKPENFIQPGVLEQGIVVKYPEKQDTGALRKVVQFFLDHQQGKITYEEGLLFMECGSGSKLHHPTKRPKVANVKKSRGTGVNQDPPDTDEEFPSPSPTPTPAPAPVPLPDTTPSVAMAPSDATSLNLAKTTTTTTAAHAGPASAPADNDEQEQDPYYDHPAKTTTTTTTAAAHAGPVSAPADNDEQEQDPYYNHPAETTTTTAAAATNAASLVTPANAGPSANASSTAAATTTTPANAGPSANAPSAAAATPNPDPATMDFAQLRGLDTMSFKSVPIHKPKPKPKPKSSPLLPAATNAKTSKPAPTTNSAPPITLPATTQPGGLPEPGVTAPGQRMPDPATEVEDVPNANEPQESNNGPEAPPITATTPADNAPSTASAIVNGTRSKAAPPTGRILQMPPRQSHLAMQYDLVPPPAPPTAPAPAVPAPAKRGRKRKVTAPEEEFTPVEESAAKKTRGKGPVESQEPTSEVEPMAAAPGRVTRKKRTAESAGIVEPEASVVTRKSQRRV